MSSPVVSASGSQTATISTEHTLSTITTAGTYQLAVDTANMVAGDEVELRVYGKARSSDTERLMYYASFTMAQASPLKMSVPIISPHYFRASLKQTAGTGRAFPWAVYSV